MFEKQCTTGSYEVSVHPGLRTSCGRAVATKTLVDNTLYENGHCILLIILRVVLHYHLLASVLDKQALCALSLEYFLSQRHFVGEKLTLSQICNRAHSSFSELNSIESTESIEFAEYYFS